jgi:hypothetical protein
MAAVKEPGAKDGWNKGRLKIRYSSLLTTDIPL